MSGEARETVYTVGHSSHPLDRFLRMLAAHGIGRVADVRSLPRSRRHPHFDAGPLAESLARLGLSYDGLPALGGLRRPRPDSSNLGLAAEGLRGYADHMETAAFARALAVLREAARRETTAVLCAEADWRHCHRSLLADALTVAGVRVLHVLDEGRVEDHLMTGCARVEGGRLHYPAGQPSLF